MSAMSMRLVVTTTLLFIIIGRHVASGESSEYWQRTAKAELDRALNRKDITTVAKNVILFVGDGMGVSTVTAARIYKGQQEGQRGEETLLFFERFPHVALIKTYNNDRQTPDSAGTSTAFLCGVKANMGTLGVTSDVIRGNCSSSKGKEVTSFLDWSLEQGKSVGIISTARVTHATPAAAYAHSADRNWEGDVFLSDPHGECKDIALQLIEKTQVQVVLGGGRGPFMLMNQTDPQSKGIQFHRKDNRDLIKEWLMDKQQTQSKSADYVWNKEQFDAIDPEKTDFLLGLFAESHMQYEIDRDTSPDGEPSLAEMTRKAIQILQKNEKGFFLFVEGGRIDHAHHDNNARRALHDAVALDDAVQEAKRLTNVQDTLTIMTADHSHVFNIGGYPERGHDILGIVKPMSMYDSPSDNMPHTTLVYGNGPTGQHRVNLAYVDTHDVDYQQEAAVRIPMETHSGEDVAVYAQGPMSHLFHGVHEQHYIAHVMSYASCVGMYREHCDGRPAEGSKHSAAATKNTGITFMWVALCSLAVYFYTY